MIDAKILIADPDEQSLNHIRAVLEKAGYQVRTTKSGTEAYTLATADLPKVCIIDPLVSGIDGFSLSRRLRIKYKELRVIFSTDSHKGEKYRSEARTRYGASAYLEKPYKDSDLVRVVGRLTGLIPPPQAKPAAASVAKPAAAVVARPQPKKHDTIPGVPISSLELDRTMDISLATMNSQLEAMRAEFLLKPSEPKSLLDDIELSDADATVHEPISSLMAGEIATKSVPVSRETAERFERTVAEPDAHLDKTVADSFARLERSAQEAANEKAPAFKPADTLISNTPLGDHRLTSEDIFGGLLKDIAQGRTRKPPPGSRPITAPQAEENTQPDQDTVVGDDTNPNQSALEIPAHSPDRTNKYELLEMIDEDQAFEIWKAKIKGEKGFERIMALKKIKPYLADNPELNILFLKEAKLAAALSHPNIVQIYELGEFEGVRFLAREFLMGESLKSILNQCRDKNATLPASIVAFLGAKIADALAHAHGARGLDGQKLDIVHHHLSPDNVIITDEGEPKVLNFGTGQVAARILGSDNLPLEQLQSLAPEQVSGKALDHRVDIFALGSLLYRALTGLDPFTGTGRESVMLRIREAATAPVHVIRPDIPQRLSDIVVRAMQGEPDRRYQTATEVARDLRDFSKSTGQRITDEDVCTYLRALRKGVVLEAPSSLPPEYSSYNEAPQPQEDNAMQEQAVADHVVHIPELLPPQRRRDSMPPTQMFHPHAPPPSGSRLWILIAILLLVLAGALVWKFVLPQRAAAPVAPPPVAQPAQTTPESAVEPELETPEPEPATSATVESPAPQASPDPTGEDALEKMNQEYLRKQEELRKKKELLKKLDENK